LVVRAGPSSIVSLRDQRCKGSAVTADTYTHFLADEKELDCEELLAA